MKKTLKSVMAIALVLTLVVCAMPFAFAGDGDELKFGTDGKFTVLQFADCQDGYPAREAMVAFINESLDFVQPDLVVFTGDNVVCEDARAYDEILNPVVARGIPFTFCFGNHDDECDPTRTKEQLLEIYQSYEGCLAYDAVPELSGTATHNLPILSSDGTKTAFNIWMFDSGDYMENSDGEKCYSCVREDQVNWYKEKSKQLETENGGLVPSLAFQHIVPQEGYELYFEAPIGLGDATKNFEDGSSYYYLPQLSTYEGYITEPPCPSEYNFGQWDAFVESGDVLALAVGHDHINSYVADIDGVDLINTPGCTWSSYGDNFMRGCRVFTLDENNPWEYDTEVIKVADLAVLDGSAIPGLEDSVSTYRFMIVLKYVLDFFNKLLTELNVPV